MALGASEFRPRLDSYNGPLDLLLFLIKKDEVDVFDIPIARIVEQYRLYLQILQQLDPNACGEFLVLLAQLIEIKSKLLLPRPTELEEDEEYEDPRLELVQQLLEFKKYKERAMLLEERLDEFSRRYRREPGAIPDPEPDFSVPLDLGGVTVWDLLTAFHRVQLALGARGPHRVVLRDRPIGEFIAIVEGILAVKPGCTATFSDLFAGVGERYDAIGILLAVLEMGKQYRLEIRLERLDEAGLEDGGRARGHSAGRFENALLPSGDDVGLDAVETDPSEPRKVEPNAVGPNLGEEIFVRLRSSEETERLEQEAHEAVVQQRTSNPVAAQLLRGEGEEARVEPIDDQDEMLDGAPSDAATSREDAADEGGSGGEPAPTDERAADTPDRFGEDGSIS